MIQDATSTYDALNRLATWSEAGNATLPAASMTYSYDANSNVRRMQSSFRYLDQAGAAYNSVATQDYWYRYDSLNRMTTSQGALSNGAIAGGTQVTYDAAGQRISVATMSSGLVWSGWKAVIKGSNGQIAMYADEPGSFEDDGYIWSPSGPVNYSGKVVESYGYDADGRLATVSVAGEGGTADNSWPTGNGVMGSAVLRASFGYDALGRLASQVDYAQDGTAVVHSRSDILYDAAGRVASETVVARQAAAAGASFTTTTTYTTYGYGVVGTAGYALGAVVTIDADTWQNGSDAAVPDTRTTYGYDWFDGAVQSSIQYRPDMNNATAYNTSFGLTPTGQVGSATIADGRQRSVAFTLDAYGQTVRRDETDNNTSLGDPHQLWYRFNGRELGTVGNDTLEDGDYASSIAARQVKQGTGPFRGGQDYGGGFARFGEAYVPYTSYAQGSGGGSYTADGGETLSQLAAQLWGDASLWYLLAEANGISSDISLIQGQAITLPQGVTRNSNTAATFKPFDPAEALGNLNPTTPKPQKKAKNCGTFGAILMVAVAVAVVAILRVPVTNLIAFGSTAAPAGVTAGIGAGIAGGAIAGAAGSIASQGFGVAAGIQDKFSWKGVALAGISGGIAGGLSQFGALSEAGKITGTLGRVGKFLGGTGVLGGAASSITGNIVSQGLGLAVGLQNKFDFAGVAVAGVIGGVSGAVGKELASKSGLFGIHASLGSNVNAALSGTASGLAGAAARSLIEGSDFGDNLMAALPDIIGATIGRAVARGVTAGSQRRLGDVSRASTALADGALSLVDDELQRTKRVFNTTTKQWEITGDGVGDVPETGPFTVWVDEAHTKIRAGTEEDRQAWLQAQRNTDLMDAGQAQLAMQAAQAVGDAVSGALSWALDGLNSVSQSFYDSAERAGAYDNPLTAPLLYAHEAAASAVHTVSSALAGIPSAVVRPVDSARNTFWSAARFFDSALTLNDRPASQVYASTYAGLSASTPREISRGSGRFFGNAALLFGPTRFGPAVRYSATPNLGMQMAARESALAAEEAAVAVRTYSGGAYGRLSAERGVIERHHAPADSVGPYTTYSGPAIQMDYADHLLTSSRGSSLDAILYRSEVKQLIDGGNMRGAMAMEIGNIRRVAVDGGGSIRKYNPAMREMLDYAYGKGWLSK